MPDSLDDLSFEALLDRSLTEPRAVAELTRRYQREAAILVADLTGMVRRTEAAGIVYALARARSARAVMQPAIEGHGGQILKQVADTVFVVFPSPRQALLGALDAQALLGRDNQQRTGSGADGGDTIEAGIGLGYGSCLLVPEQDVFGAEVNRACVLGRYVAAGGEVLLSPGFLQALGPLPEGIGGFEASAARADEIGFRFLQARDYRE